jgi:hypothetical protein
MNTSSTEDPQSTVSSDYSTMSSISDGNESTGRTVTSDSGSSESTMSTENTTFNSDNVTTINPTGESTSKPYLCYPNEFPIGNGACMSAPVNGGFIITAFILSIVSFAGVIVRCLIFQK